MSVLLETSVGWFVVDLYTKECPRSCYNFLKLCKLKYYNNHLIYNVEKDFLFQSGDPTGTGKGGNSIYEVMEGGDLKHRFFQNEVNLEKYRHNKRGLLCMAHANIPLHQKLENEKIDGITKDLNTSQFYITLTDKGMDHLDGKYTIFGIVAEDPDNVLDTINEQFVDDENRPSRDIRILHTDIIDDPYPDDQRMLDYIQKTYYYNNNQENKNDDNNDFVYYDIDNRKNLYPPSPKSRKPKEEKLVERFSEDIKLDDKHFDADGEEDDEVMREEMEEYEARRREIVLELLGDRPSAELKAPDNVLFVCRLNKMTRDDDLHTIFSRFGKILSCKVVRDHETQESLQYAFIEFAEKKSCEKAYQSMDNVKIDERHIKVDFSQSVSHLWNKYTGQIKQTKRTEGKNIQRQGKRLYEGRDTTRARDNTDNTSQVNERNIDKSRRRYPDERYGDGERYRDGDNRRSADNGRYRERDRDERGHPEDRYRERDRDERRRPDYRDRDRDERRYPDDRNRDRNEWRYSPDYRDRDRDERRYPDDRNRDRDERRYSPDYRGRDRDDRRHPDYRDRDERYHSDERRRDKNDHRDQIEENNQKNRRARTIDNRPAWMTRQESQKEAPLRTEKTNDDDDVGEQFFFHEERKKVKERKAENFHPEPLRSERESDHKSKSNSDSEDDDESDSGSDSGSDSDSGSVYQEKGSSRKKKDKKDRKSGKKKEKESGKKSKKSKKEKKRKKEKKIKTKKKKHKEED